MYGILYVLALAAGSSLDSEEAVRQAAYSQHERERQATSAARLADAPIPLPHDPTMKR
jgi:hypothetical protein